ncbi:hypothetical protein CLDAP_26310 [Caldilinea aerophila DSM 14535 = NBRC 104270]|uniref:Uncharacterized protein n=1 Tax=Caldilinea aerophila (strain DSM 14535 / JCM 11387 / NBRC 104270 / STL-6-O1) TaxID=926550 RepID=I0I5Y3_CALAS|nr:hypothetical protein CLDAP_26310 [Caldilinea aerophila DSM 14535 = NBRC 104270]
MGVFDPRRRTAAVPGGQRCQPLPVEARDQVRNGIARSAASRTRSFGVALAICNGQQRLGPGHMAGRFAAGAADMRQHFSFFVC